MHHPVADELRIGKGGNHGEHPLLLPEFQVGLEAHQIEHRLFRVVLPQLHHGVGLLPGGRVGKAHGLQRAEAQGVEAPAGHDLHGHTALKDIFVLEAVHLRLLSGHQLPDKGLILSPVHGAVDVVRGAPVVPGLPPGLGHIDGLGGHQGRCRVEKVEIIRLPEVFPDGLGQGIGGQGSGSHDHRPFRDGSHFLLDNGDIGVAADFFRHQPGKALTIHRQTPSGLHPGLLRAGKNQAAAAAQLLLQKANGVFQPIPPEGVGAHQLRKVRAVVGGGHLLGLHFV